ncbi:MAG TPA: YHS domain-containing protein [Candidatus Limnocylindrales bacterium]
MRDPVCGMELAVRDAVASAVTDGRQFYFCCLRCHAAFLDTPHRFAGWAGDPSGRPPAAVSTRTSVGPEPCHLASLTR